MFKTRDGPARANQPTREHCDVSGTAAELQNMHPGRDAGAAENAPEPKEEAKSLQDLADAAQGYAKKQFPEAAKTTPDTYARSYYDIVPKRQRNGGTIMAKPHWRLE